MADFHITRFTKQGGSLSKRIALTPDGTLKSDGNACVMVRGSACRIILSDIHQLARLIETMRSNEAIGLGTLRPDLPLQVEITTKQNLNLNGIPRPDLIARTADYIVYLADTPGLALLDFDTKGMPRDVAADAGGPA